MSKRVIVFADERVLTSAEAREEQRQEYSSRTGASRSSNCECGKVIRVGSGQVCERCGCLQCSRCTMRTPAGPVCNGCIPLVEQEQMQYKPWRK